MRNRLPTIAFLFAGAACGASNGNTGGPISGPSGSDAGGVSNITPTTDAMASSGARFPLTLVADVDMPGKPVRFDYEDIDSANGHLVVAHMNDASVLILNAKDGSLAKLLPNIPTARGVVVASDVGRIFVTSSPNQLVIIDSTSLAEIGRVATGDGPDGVGWDPVHKTVGVSDQGDGAVSLIAGSGGGARTQVPLGRETGNVVFDAPRGRFWAAVVAASPPDQLMAIDPVTATVTTRIPLPGCDGAHGLRIHPDGQSAFVACEGNNVLARVDLGNANTVVTSPTGSGPDVLSIDPGLHLLYIAAESGDLTVFDIAQAGLAPIDHEHPGDNAHSVVVDPSTHHVFFPLTAGPKGTPVMRIMKPSGA